MNPKPKTSALLDAEILARQNQVTAVKAAEAERDTAAQAIDRKAVKAQIDQYSSDVSATAGGLEDTLSEKRFSELRKSIADWTGRSDVDQVVQRFNEILEREAVEEDPSLDLGRLREGVRTARTERDAAQQAVTDRKQFVDQLKATIESLAEGANAAFKEAETVLDSAFTTLEKPADSDVAATASAVLRQLIDAEAKAEALRKPLGNEAPLKASAEEPFEFEVLCYGVKSRDAMEAWLIEYFDDAVGEYHAAAESLLEKEKSLAGAQRDLEIAEFKVQQFEAGKDQKLIEAFEELERQSQQPALAAA